MRGVTLVIGSGGVKCASALGIIKVLEREGIDVGMVVGCSGGSIYATAIALGWSTEQIIEVTTRLWTREITSRRNRWAILSILFPRRMKFGTNFGLVDDSLILARLQDAFGNYGFSDAAKRLYITATDFNSGEQVTMHTGSLVDAIRASIAIPYIFKPWKIDGRLMVDGYMSDPLPIGVAIKHGAHVILAIGFEADHQRHVNSLLRFAFQLSSVASNNLLRANFAFYNAVHHDEIIPIIPKFKERISLFDTEKIPYLIEEGERAMEGEISYVRSLIEAAPS